MTRLSSSPRRPVRCAMIVGTSFAACACAHLGGVYTIRQLLDGEVPRYQALIIGQGLSYHEREEVAQENEARDFPGFSLLRPLAPRNLVHKSRLENILVTIPERRSERAFVLDLVYDQRAEVGSDHQSGQHVPGMILGEVARQSCLAVTEQFFLGDDLPAPYFMIESIVTQFERFTFPFPAEIHYTILEADLRPGRLRFVAQIDTVQLGQRASRVHVEFSARDRARLKTRENELAAEALDRCLQDHLCVLSGGL